MKDINIKPCANGILCSAAYDEKDNTVVIFDKAGVALGYFDAGEIVASMILRKIKNGD